MSFYKINFFTPSCIHFPCFHAIAVASGYKHLAQLNSLELTLLQPITLFCPWIKMLYYPTRNTFFLIYKTISILSSCKCWRNSTYVARSTLCFELRHKWWTVFWMAKKWLPHRAKSTDIDFQIIQRRRRRKIFL